MRVDMDQSLFDPSSDPDHPALPRHQLPPHGFSHRGMLELRGKPMVGAASPFSHPQLPFQHQLGLGRSFVGLHMEGPLADPSFLSGRVMQGGGPLLGGSSASSSSSSSSFNAPRESRASTPDSSDPQHSPHQPQPRPRPSHLHPHPHPHHQEDPRHGRALLHEPHRGHEDISDGEESHAVRDSVAGGEQRKDSSAPVSQLDFAQRPADHAAFDDSGQRKDMETEESSRYADDVCGHKFHDRGGDETAAENIDIDDDQPLEVDSPPSSPLRPQSHSTPTPAVTGEGERCGDVHHQVNVSVNNRDSGDDMNDEDDVGNDRKCDDSFEDLPAGDGSNNGQYSTDLERLKDDLNRLKDEVDAEDDHREMMTNGGVHDDNDDDSVSYTHLTLPTMAVV